MSCRTGPLRVGRPLRGVYTGLAEMIGNGPPVGREMNDPDQREGRSNSFRPDKLRRRANARPTRSGPVRQDTVSNQLGQLGGKLLDLDEEGLVVVDANAVDEEDDATGAGDGDEHPCMDGETEDRRL
jgi:hypothetical protein